MDRLKDQSTDRQTDRYFNALTLIKHITQAFTQTDNIMKAFDNIMKSIYNIMKPYVQYYEIPKWYIMNSSAILVIYRWMYK